MKKVNLQDLLGPFSLFLIHFCVVLKFVFMFVIIEVVFFFIKTLWYKYVFIGHRSYSMFLIAFNKLKRRSSLYKVYLFLLRNEYGSVCKTRLSTQTVTILTVTKNLLSLGYNFDLGLY